MIKTIDYRNGTYQGYCSQQLIRDGFGIFIQRDMRFIACEWSNNLIHGNAIVFFSHRKFIYGEWNEGVPSGVNVYNCDNKMLFTNFRNGQIHGQAILIYKDLKICVVFQIKRNEYRIINKFENVDLEDLKQLIMSIHPNIKQNHFYLNSFMKNSFSKFLNVEIKQRKIHTFFGYHNGLGILFNGDYFIKIIGTNVNRQGLCNSGYGIKFVNEFSQIEEGDFERRDTIKYLDKNRSVKKIRQIFRSYCCRSIRFLNEYVSIEHPIQFYDYLSKISTIQEIQMMTTLDNSKHQQIQQIMQPQLNNIIKFPTDLNQKNTRLKVIRQELYKQLKVNNKQNNANKQFKQPDPNMFNTNNKINKKRKSIFQYQPIKIEDNNYQFQQKCSPPSKQEPNSNMSISFKRQLLDSYFNNNSISLNSQQQDSLFESEKKDNSTIVSKQKNNRAVDSESRIGYEKSRYQWSTINKNKENSTYINNMINFEQQDEDHQYSPVTILKQSINTNKKIAKQIDHQQNPRKLFSNYYYSFQYFNHKNRNQISKPQTKQQYQIPNKQSVQLSKIVLQQPKSDNTTTQDFNFKIKRPVLSSSYQHKQNQDNLNTKSIERHLSRNHKMEPGNRILLKKY